MNHKPLIESTWFVNFYSDFCQLIAQLWWGDNAKNSNHFELPWERLIQLKLYRNFTRDQWAYFVTHTHTHIEWTNHSIIYKDLKLFPMISNEIVSLIAFAVIKKDARSRDAKCEFDEATHDRMIFDTQYHNIIFFLSASNRSHCHWLGKLIHLIPSRCSKKNERKKHFVSN